MEHAYNLLKLLHILGFVFMSIPLFSLIVVNERALMGGFDFKVDRYMENIIRRGAARCYVFQSTALVTGVLLLVVGPLGIEALWENWVLLAKTVLLFALMGLLSVVHLRIQPQVEAVLAGVDPEATEQPDYAARLKPHRVLRKRLATVCLFFVLAAIILGVQVYGTLSVGLNV